MAEGMLMSAAQAPGSGGQQDTDLQDDVADREVSPGPGPVEPPPEIVAEGTSLEHDLGLLRPLAGWDAVVSRLARAHLMGALAVVWWLASTMLAQLEDQLEIMHLAGDRAFSLAALDDAGATLPGVLATWRRWQLGAGPSFVVGPGSIIAHELALNLVPPLAPPPLLAVGARGAWSGCEGGFRRDIAAAAV